MGPSDSLAGRQPSRDELKSLVELTIGMGATGVKVLPASAVLAEDHLAALCKETKCPNYDLSPTCPPNVEGPTWMREYLQEIDAAMFIKVELPPDVMYSDARREIGKLLHFIVIQVEQAAIEMGLSKSRAFAGGSCKNLLCHDKANCQVLYGDGQCRNPNAARPSISGYGINVNRLNKAAGWSGSENDENKATMSTYCGLVLLG
jgi:predicted metal-binding protein